MRRFLESLAQQNERAFDLVFVDYGSRAAVASEVRSLVEGYPFARYLYSETRGRPWSRGRALNIGIRHAKGSHVLCTDVDMVFEADFLRTVCRHLDPDHVIYCAARFLPRSFTEWDGLKGVREDIAPAGRSAYGGCQCVPRPVLERIRGFDEAYLYWGGEDRDLAGRLRLVGLEEVWLEDRTAIYHQWHPQADFKVPGAMPIGHWARSESYLQESAGLAERNADDWGRVLELQDRPVFSFLDLEGGAVRDRERVEVFSAPVHHEQAGGELVRKLAALEPGQALAVRGASLPRRRGPIDLGIRLTNRVLRGISPGSEVAYRANVLHAALADALEGARGRYLDYFLNFPAEGGVTIVTPDSR